MAVAKNPGAGRGQGGGRPKREGPVELVQLRLSPEAAERLKAAALAAGVPAWQLVERWAFEMAPAVSDPDPMSTEARQIAREADGLLASAEDRAAALKTLQRAWRQALTLARHKTSPTPEERDPES